MAVATMGGEDVDIGGDDGDNDDDHHAIPSNTQESVNLFHEFLLISKSVARSHGRT